MIKMVKIPRILVEHAYYKNLSDRAKVLYGILWEKKQEAASRGWVDDNGVMYVVFPKRKMQEELSCSRYRLDLVTKELVATDLIELGYGVGSNLERRIYVHGFAEVCPWIQVEYGLREEMEKEPEESVNEKVAADKDEPEEVKGSEKEDDRPLGGGPDQDGPDDSCKVADPAKLLKMLLENEDDHPSCKGISWPVLLDALASAIF